MSIMPEELKDTDVLIEEITYVLDINEGVMQVRWHRATCEHGWVLYAERYSSKLMQVHTIERSVVLKESFAAKILYEGLAALIKAPDHLYGSDLPYENHS